MFRAVVTLIFLKQFAKLDFSNGSCLKTLHLAKRISKNSLWFTSDINNRYQTINRCFLISKMKLKPLKFLSVVPKIFGWLERFPKLLPGFLYIPATNA